MSCCRPSPIPSPSPPPPPQVGAACARVLYALCVANLRTDAQRCVLAFVRHVGNHCAIGSSAGDGDCGDGPAALEPEALMEAAGLAAVRHPELDVSTPAHAEHPGWYVEFEFRVTQGAVRTESGLVYREVKKCLSSMRQQHRKERRPFSF